MKIILSKITLSAILCFLISACCGTDDKNINSAAYRNYSSFNPGQVLLDNNGRHVNAHGAGFIYLDGKYYMFGEHKLGGTIGNKSIVGVHCYSSSDLYNWKDEGIALKMSGDSRSDIIKGTILERPKVVYNEKTKKYVMLMHLEFRKGKTANSVNLEDIDGETPNYDTAKVGFAVADNITGPYKYLRSVRPNAKKMPVNNVDELNAAKKELDEKYPHWKNVNVSNVNKELVKGHRFWIDFENGQMSRDLTVFVDDDKKAYLVCASEANATLHISELTDDYLDFTGKYARAMAGESHEAPAIFKARGKYYMFSSYCTGWKPNAGRISQSDKIFGEWKQTDNPCRGTKEENADTFKSQSTYVIKLEGKPDAFIYVGDRWTPKDAIDGRYIFLPIEWENNTPIIKWRDSWDLSFFDKKIKKQK